VKRCDESLLRAWAARVETSGAVLARRIAPENFVEGVERCAEPNCDAQRYRAWILFIAAGLTAVRALASSAIGLDRQGLRLVVHACVADFKLTGSPFPCLEVDVVLHPPLRDIILASTRRIIGIEDPFLQPRTGG